MPGMSDYWAAYSQRSSDLNATIAAGNWQLQNQIAANNLASQQLQRDIAIQGQLRQIQNSVNNSIPRNSLYTTRHLYGY
jgi:hypothetical protein